MHAMGEFNVLLDMPWKIINVCMCTGTHAEVGDGSGTVRGAFSYVDPAQQVRTVEYVADEQGRY
jgi:hypothetical protein